MGRNPITLGAAAYFKLFLKQSLIYSRFGARDVQLSIFASPTTTLIAPESNRPVSNSLKQTCLGSLLFPNGTTRLPLFGMGRNWSLFKNRRGVNYKLQSWKLLSSTYRWDFQQQIPSGRQTGLRDQCNSLALPWLDVSTNVTYARKSRWFSRNHCYATLKIHTSSKVVTREIEIYNHLQRIQSSHAGQSCLRPLIEIFEAQNLDGHNTHTCLVHPPLGISLDQLTPLLPDKVMSSSMVRTTMRNILAALDFLHTEAHVIHTG